MWVRERLVPLTWLAAAVLILGAAAGLSVPKANAFAAGTTMQVTVTWTGGNCLTRGGIKPVDGDARFLAPFYVAGCSDTGNATQFVRPGQWYGADPDIGDAYAVSCTVTNMATRSIVLIDYARHGDGHNATCLGRA